MIRDEPQGADLLSEARRVLADHVLPNLSSDMRYQTLMVVRAISLVESQLRASSDTESGLRDKLAMIAGDQATEREPVQLLSEQIRTGARDASAEVFCFLKQVAAFKIDETNSGKK